MNDEKEILINYLQELIIYCVTEAPPNRKQGIHIEIEKLKLYLTQNEIQRTREKLSNNSGAGNGQEDSVLVPPSKRTQNKKKSKSQNRKNILPRRNGIKRAGSKVRTPRHNVPRKKKRIFRTGNRTKSVPKQTNTQSTKLARKT